MQKIKYFLESQKGKDILIILIVLFLGISSFFLGRLSKENQKGLEIKYLAQEASVLSSTSPDTSLNSSKMLPKEAFNLSMEGKLDLAPGKYFASKIGHKYYPITCSAGKNIKLENRIYFQSISEAEKAGYQLSASCR